MEVHIYSGMMNPHDPMTTIWTLLGLFGVALVVAPMLSRWLNGK